MKKIALTLMASVLFIGCNNDDNAFVPAPDTSVEFTFTQNWDGDPIENSDFDIPQYVNANGESMSISKLVYLISDITFVSLTTAETFDAGDYNLVNVREQTNLTFTPDIEIPEGEYLVSFTFGFDDEDNQDGIYQDLNSADGGWNVPMMLGGGYHYMRLEGKYIDGAGALANYAYHTIRAADNSTTPITLQDTSFEVSLGQITIGSNTNIEVEMNVAEWFKNPNTWDLNVLNTVLMPNFDAQIMMFENGSNFATSQGVFSLGNVTQ
jgi:uncharacterized lipoprotein NlpE involved in copper resistance